MLSKKEALHEIAKKNLEISYEFDPSGNGDLLASPTDVADENGLGRKIFEANYFGNRLSFTLGPLVLSHRYRWRRGRKRFKGRPYVYDLRETGGQFTIEPGEAITVNTIEHLTLGPDLGALTLPRLSHATVGVVLSTSYVDPYWSGIMVFHITNTSPSPFILKFGEKIGACHFYKVTDTDLTSDFRNKFSAKSHHYGQSWRKIINDDADPFPQKKRAALSDRKRLVSAVGEWTQKHWKSALATVGISAVAGGLIVVGSYLKEIEGIRALPSSVASQTSQISSQSSIINSVLNNAPKTGELLITLPAGQSISKTQQRLSVPQGSSPKLILAGANPDVPSVNVSASMSKISDTVIEISIVASRSAAAQDSFQQFPVSYVVFFT